MIPGDQPLSVMPNGPGDLNCWPLGPKQKVKFSKHGVALTPRMDANGREESRSAQSNSIRNVDWCLPLTPAERAGVGPSFLTSDPLPCHSQGATKNHRTFPRDHPMVFSLYSTRSDRRGLQLVSQANCLRRLTRVRIRSASRAASNGLRKVSLNTDRSKPEALSSSLRRPIRTVSVNSEFFRRF